MLKKSIKDGVVILQLNRPNSRNSLSTAILRELDAELNILQADEYCKEYRCVIIKNDYNDSTVFSSGHDLKEMTNIMYANDLNETEKKQKFEDLFQFCSSVMRKITEIPQPVIAQVNGIASAAGAQLVAQCDLAVGTRNLTKFTTPGVNIGLFCSTPAVSIARNVGKKKAMDMLLTARLIDATEAYNFGLLSHIVDENDQESIDEFTLDLAKTIASRSGIALAIGKKAFYKQMKEDELSNAYSIATEAMRDGIMKQDAFEGISAFVEKRKPTWKHV